MRESTRVFINTITSWAATLANGLIGFFLVPFLILKLGKEGYGLTALVGTIIGLTGILDMGLRTALSRQLTEQIARKDKQRFNELASSALILYLVIGSVCAIILIGFAPAIARAFRVSEHLMPQAIFLIRWYGSCTILLSFVGPVFSATLIGLNRFDLLNVQQTCIALLRGACLFLILGLSSAGLYGWAVVNLLASVLGFITITITAYTLWPNMRLSWEFFRAASLKPVCALGGYMFALQITNLLSVQSDPLILSTFLGPGAVALYTPALALTALFRPMVLTLADQMHPLATRLHVTQNQASLQAVLLRGTRYTLLMGIPVCVLFGVFAEPLCRMWLEKSLRGDYRIVAHVLVAWALVDLVTYSGGTQWAVLLGRQRLKFLVWVQIPFAIVNIILSALLVGYTSLGVLGVVVPTVLIGFIRRPLLIRHTAHACGLTAGRYLKESYLRPIIVMGLLTLAAVLIRVVVVPDNIWILAIQAGMIGLLWMALCWIVGLTRSDRQAFLMLCHKGLGKVELGTAGRPAVIEAAAPVDRV
jgi:O-antigen/teichoic acid export membrane protein